MEWELCCSECGERLEVEDVDELYGVMYVKPCENCLDEKVRMES